MLHIRRRSTSFMVDMSFEVLLFFNDDGGWKYSASVWTRILSSNI